MIEFPHLWNLSFNIDPIAFQIGEVPIFWYGIIIATGFLLAVLLGMKDSKKFGIDSENIIDLVLVAAPVAIIFARIYYVIFSWDEYRETPSEIFKIWHGGLAIYGGVIGALLAAYVFSRVRKINILTLLDFTVPYLALAQGIGRWGNFVNQEAFGTNTSLPWGMTGDQIKSQLALLQLKGMNVDPGLPVHPTFLYESLWNLAAFFFLAWYRRKKKVDGEVFFLYMIIYGAGRFWIEGLRTDSLMVGNLRISQLLAFLFVVAFSIWMVIRRQKAMANPPQEAGPGSSEYGSVLKKLMAEEDIGNSSKENDTPAGEEGEGEPEQDGGEAPGEENGEGTEEQQESSPQPEEEKKSSE